MGTSLRPSSARPRPASPGSGRGALLALAVSLLLAACEATGPATAVPTTGISPTGGPLPTASESALDTAAPTAPEGGPWLPAGQLGTPRLAPHLVALGDGRVLAVGNDASCVEPFPGAPGDSDIAELWDPGTGRWTKTASLNTPRAKNAALLLADGRVLVAGGATEGRWDNHAEQLGFQSYSSAWTFDPRTESWAKTDLMRAARTDAASAVLPDGRVLVAGGYFADLIDANDYGWLVGAAAGLDGVAGRADAGAVVTAGWPAGGELADVGPPQPPTTVLATAELFDPATGLWSSTGPMAAPRYGASAVTLADGRVLVAGEDSTGVRGYGLYPEYGEFGENVAEVFDPRTGRFRVTGEYPERGSYGMRRPAASATLVALADGGALLVGGYDDEGMPDTGTLRFDPKANTWSETGRMRTPRAHAVAALLADETVLVAGGEDAFGPTASAELFDPIAGTWSPAPAMPEPRIGGGATVLADGSVLIAGGYGAHSHQSGDYLCPSPIAATVRFVPAP